MPAVLFGSISTIADTSEIQRQAFNDAFAAHGLDWNWDQDQYRGLLASSGGKDRIAEYARTTGADVDADAVHRDKSERFQRALATSDLSPRPGVAETIHAAKDRGFKVAFVTTTARENLDALLAGLGDSLDKADFDLIVDANTVDQPKPDKAAYAYALDALGEDGAACVAIEDNLGGIAAAASAGVHTVAFPNENTAGHDFDQADERVDRLEFSALETTVAA